MSSIDPWCFESSSLKYIATVEAVQFLWRHLKFGDSIKKCCNKMIQRQNSSNPPLSTLRQLVSQKFDSYVDKLELPKAIQDDLSFFSWEMYKQMFDKLEIGLRACMPTSDPRRFSNNISLFVDCVIWDDIGCLTEKKMMEYRFSQKETIDYDFWLELCSFCSENYIRKFSRTIDWTRRRANPEHNKFASNIPIYWYNQIYGTFPTKEMFDSSADFNKFQNQREAGVYEESNFHLTLFRESIRSERLPAVRYFWNKLTEAQKLQVSLEVNFSNIESIDVKVYLLAQTMKFNYSPTTPGDCGPWGYLLCWPWILFIDSWIGGCRNMTNDEFLSIFNVFMELRKTERQGESIEEFARRQSRGHLLAKYYIPCEKLWALCHEKFGSASPILPKLVAVLFLTEDITLCRIVMKGSTSAWRKICLNEIRGLHRILSRSSGNNRPKLNFCDQFMKEILENEEERSIFQNIAKEICRNR